MSHNHVLRCARCREDAQAGSGGNTPDSCYRRFSGLCGDALVKHALSVRELIGDFVFSRHAEGWALFVAAHAGCNAFYEVCENSEEYYQAGPMPDVPARECGNAPRRIPVKGHPEPPCGRCHGRGNVVVACPECMPGGEKPG